MTRFIDVASLSDYIGQTGVETLIEKMVEYLEQDYRRWNDFEKSARLASHSDIGVIELMPVSDQHQYAFKYVNGHPDNLDYNLPTVMAFGVLADVATGYPVLLSELTLTTAIRTAATSVMAAKYMARPDSRVMALIGNGSQSEFQALAFHKVLGIEEVRCFDVDPTATAKFIDNLSGVEGLRLVHCHSARDACEGADIVTTVTADKRLATILTPDMVGPGMHINAVGGDCPGKTEIHADILRQGRIFVEFEPQTRIEGDIQQLAPDHPVTEMWRLIAEHRSGRANAGEITIFDSVGFALEDYSALRLLFDLAESDGIGRFIELVPNLDDPRDLFSLTRGGKKRARLRKVA
ncbi:ornithine cyclodeaminase [Zobellella denitrificans]|uniref:Ornithine cyclodeaminase n=1 Tax=Zobellella denitrificans TaxID=347534 RepID=A0A291HMJ4_9GAMM|nr:ornithine cyclodeaminase [Zobellella denitrificans]ATG73410.1 ornithine cyclodeaminase [Zobellella denitrificans]